MGKHFPGNMDLLSEVPGIANLQGEDLSGNRLKELPGAQVNPGTLTVVQEATGRRCRSYRQPPGNPAQGE